jgi:hypothetical protein
MSDLSKLDCRIAIESRLADVKAALKELDKLTAKAESLELELSKLKAQESAILADNSKDDESKLPDLLAVRGLIDMKASAIAVLRGTPSQGNNRPGEKGKVELAQEAVSAAGTVVSQFLRAFHDAAKLTFQEHIANVTSAFVLPEDVGFVTSVASRHPTFRQLSAWSPPLFAEDHIRGWSDATSLARHLDLIWQQLLETAEAIPHEFAPVSIPDPWL